MKKLIPVMFAWWLCLSFHSMQDLVAAMSMSPPFMTQAQMDAAKITSVAGEDDYLIFQSNYAMTNGQAKQETYVANLIQLKTGITATTCSEY